MAVFCLWKMVVVELTPEERDAETADLLFGLLEISSQALATRQACSRWRQTAEDVYVERWQGSREEAIAFARKYRKVFYDEERKEKTDGTKTTATREG